jgi:CBS domain-containing protein
MLDVKGSGGIQLVGAARVLALELGLSETATADRFRAAAARGLYRPEQITEMIDAHEDLLRLRLVHQLDRLHAGQAPDNHVPVRALSHRDRVLLREALATVARVQRSLRERFATDFVG